MQNENDSEDINNHQITMWIRLEHCFIGVLPWSILSFSEKVFFIFWFVLFMERNNVFHEFFVKTYVLKTNWINLRFNGFCWENSFRYSHRVKSKSLQWKLFTHFFRSIYSLPYSWLGLQDSFVILRIEVVEQHVLTRYAVTVWEVESIWRSATLPTFVDDCQQHERSRTETHDSYLEVYRSEKKTRKSLRILGIKSPGFKNLVKFFRVSWFFSARAHLLLW